MRPAPGDWGIDALIGELSDSIAIWQAKFFPHGARDTRADARLRGYASARAAPSVRDAALADEHVIEPAETDLDG
jgi:hypothetical protein